MILYNITINIDEEVYEEWMQWMQQKYIPAMISTGLITSNKIFQLMKEEEMGGLTYAFQFFFRSMEDYENYRDNFEAQHQAILYARYKGRYVDFKTVLKQV